MQYPYLTSLEIFSFLLILFIGILVFYFLIKRWQKTNFLTVLKAIVLYELGSFLLYLIYPFSLLSRTFGNSIFKILNLLLFVIISFFIFYFVMKKVLLMNWKKSLIIFILVILILFPFLDFFRVSLEMKIINLPIFAKENLEIEKQMKSCMQNLFFCLSTGFYEPLPLKIIGKIESGTISWPSNYLRQTIIQVGNEPPEKTPEYYVKVISPNGGEQIEGGRLLDIKWDSKNIGSVNVSLLSSDNLAFDTIDIVRICSKVDASLGHCEGKLTNFHTAHYYKIRIEGFREKPMEKLTYAVANDDSDNYFSITGNFIFVLSPNGGEKIQGDSVIIWGSNNVENIIITLMENNSKSYLISKSFDASRGYFDWKIDKSADYIGRSDLKIVLYDAAYCSYVDQSIGVECTKDDVSHSDSSDNYFSILKQ